MQATIRLLPALYRPPGPDGPAARRQPSNQNLVTAAFMKETMLSMLSLFFFTLSSWLMPDTACNTKTPLRPVCANVIIEGISSDSCTLNSLAQ
jgi:hypothetical protein